MKNLVHRFNRFLGTYAFTLIAVILFTACSEQREPVDYVDPFIGTNFFGHTFPGASVPYAMVHLSPDVDTKGWRYASGYNYQDNSIYHQK